MARIRSIKPDFWTDEKVVELSAFARLLFIGLWNFADDEGRMQFSPKKIKMQIFPADTLDISELFGEIRSNSLITVYVIDNVEYLQINNFAKHQKIDKRTASKLPSPESSPEFPRIPTTEGKGREGNGRDIPPSEGAKNTAPENSDPIFGHCLEFLKAKGSAEKGARSFLGLMRKEHGDINLVMAIERAERDDISEPIPWIKQFLAGNPSKPAIGVKHSVGDLR